MIIDYAGNAKNGRLRSFAVPETAVSTLNLLISE